MVKQKPKYYKPVTKAENKDKEDEFDPTNPEHFARRPKGGGMPQRSHFMTPRVGTAEHPKIPAHVQASAEAHEQLGQARISFGDANTLGEAIHIPVHERGSEYKIPVHVAALAHAAFGTTVEK